MQTTINQTVNRLPATTYRFLQMNASAVTGEEIRIDAGKGPALQGTLPAGVTKSVLQTDDEVQAYFAPVRAMIADAVQKGTLPNGDTTRDSTGRQALPTGMGEGIDEILRGQQVQTDVYTVAAGTRCEEELILNYHMAPGEGILHRFIVHAKAGAEVTVVTDYHTDREADGFLGVQTLLLAEEGARIHLVRVQMLGEAFLHFDDLGGALLGDAAITFTRMELGARRSWHGCRMSLLGDGAKFHSHVGYLTRRDQKLDLNYVAHQFGKKTDATMLFRGVLADRGEKTFRGTLDFHSGSAGSTGDEQEDTLILSPDAVNRAIPVILCQEEDVQGRHGATIGQIPDDLLFYMQARGIDEEEARRIMIRARLLAVARDIPERHLRGHVEDYLRKTL